VLRRGRPAYAEASAGRQSGVRVRKSAGVDGGARAYNWSSLVIIGRIEGCFCLMVAWRRIFLFFSGIFRTFPLAGPFYRAIVNWRRPGGLGWAGRSGQSGVVSLGPLYINATHIVKGKNEAAGRGDQTAG